MQITFKLFAVLMVLPMCLGRTEQSTSTQRSDYESLQVYFVAVQSSGLTTFVQALKLTLGLVRATLNLAPVSWTTHELREGSKALHDFVTKTTDLAIHATNGLMAMAIEKHIIVEEQFEQFEIAHGWLKKYTKKRHEKYIAAIGAHIGCPLAHQFNEVWRSIKFQLNHVAKIVESIKQAIQSSRTRRGFPAERRLSTFADLLGGLKSMLKHLRTSASTFAVTVRSAIIGLSSANTFVRQFYYSHNVTFIDFSYARTTIRMATAIQQRHVQWVYNGLQRSIITNLSNALAQLFVFRNNGNHLKELADRFHGTYHRVYNFLNQRSRVHSGKLEKNFRNLQENANRVLGQAFDMFFDAAHRTELTAMDIVTERGPSSDNCFTTYSNQLRPVYFRMSALSQQCIAREMPRWNTMGPMVSNIAALALKTVTELTINIGRCATYFNYVTSSVAYAQAKACLTTNLEDMQDLGEMVDQQFDQIQELVREQISSSKYRLENCYFARLHELTGYLKSTRIGMESCAGQYYECSRKNRHNDGRDWYERKRRKEVDSDTVTKIGDTTV